MAVTVSEWSKRLRTYSASGLTSFASRQGDILGLTAVREARANATKSPKRRSGRLWNSIRHRVSNRGEKNQTVTITAGGPRVPYARIQELGGIIRAKNAPYLVFKIGNRWISKKQVRLPARRYLSKAVAKVLKTQPPRMAEALAVDFIDSTTGGS